VMAVDLKREPWELDRERAREGVGSRDASNQLVELIIEPGSKNQDRRLPLIG